MKFKCVYVIYISIFKTLMAIYIHYVHVIFFPLKCYLKNAFAVKVLPWMSIFHLDFEDLLQRFLKRAKDQESAARNSFVSRSCSRGIKEVSRRYSAKIKRSSQGLKCDVARLVKVRSYPLSIDC